VSLTTRALREFGQRNIAEPLPPVESAGGFEHDGERTAVKEALETHLRHEPTKTSRSRIKRLRGIARPQYRLRVEEVRVFYDVSGSAVEVLAIVPKPEAESWLARYGSSK
jgi:mRNA-degrading endonuclease RelE of RelBE toxin-antitoxin system